MKKIVVLLGLLMVSAVAASLQAAPTQSDANRRQATGEFSQWAQRQQHQACACVIAGYTVCMDQDTCLTNKHVCAGTCPR